MQPLLKPDSEWRGRGVAGRSAALGDFTGRAGLGNVGHHEGHARKAAYSILAAERGDQDAAWLLQHYDDNQRPWWCITCCRRSN